MSGGPDSRALLEAWARYRHPSVSVVCVVDHGRRPSSAVEAGRVCRRALELGLESEAVTLALQHGDEATMREARYDALQQVADRRGLGGILLAHHLGDVAEGLLLHLVGQGGGRGGRSPRPVEPHDSGIVRIRPFLGLTKACLQASLDSIAVDDVVIDEDDAAGTNARGRLRLTVLGPLASLRPAIEEALARHARLLREDDDLIEGLVPGSPTVPASLPAPVLRRWLRRRIQELAADPRTAGDAIDTALRLAAAGDTGSVSVRGGTVQIRRTPTGPEVAVEAGAGQSPKKL